MSEYTDQLNRTIADIEYIEQSESISSIEATNGLYTVTYVHGGKTITVIRDTETGYREGDSFTVAPTDEQYIKLKAKYHNVKPIIPRLVSWINKVFK